MGEEKYNFTQICKRRKINSEIWKRNKDFQKRNPSFLVIKKIISIDYKSQFIPESSKINILSFNSYGGIEDIGEKEINKALEFIDSLRDSLGFYEFIFLKLSGLIDSQEYRDFIEDIYINHCIEIGYIPEDSTRFLNSLENSLGRMKNFNPLSISENLSNLPCSPNKWGFSNFIDFPSLFKSVYESRSLASVKDREIQRMGNLSLEKFLSEIEMKFKGYKKQIIY